MMTKKLLVLMMALLVAFMVVGCGGPDEEPMTDPEPTGTTIDEPPMEDPVIEEEPEQEMVAPAQLDPVFFAFDQHKLSAEAKGILEGNADELKRDEEAMVTIEGHCDERGTKSYNIALGEKRANAAKDYLVALGIAGSRITVVSYGKERPFVTGNTEAAWAKNRRAHFKLK